MRHLSFPPATRRWRVLLAAVPVAGATIALSASPSAAAPRAHLAGTTPQTTAPQASAPDFPAYALDDSPTLDPSLTGDIAGSAFTGRDGAFHWISSYAGYSATDIGYSYTTTYTNTDLGTVNSQVTSGTTADAADTYQGNPGSLCYQIDKAPVNPAPSPQEDDHCDVVGIWVDPSTGVWHGVVNDEYDFDPWGPAGETTGQRILKGIHGDRILTAYSSDQGKSWHYGGEIVTSPVTDHDAVDATSDPGTTWDYGVAGTRLYIDYATGYFYLTYNRQIKLKPGYTTVYSWDALARAPISGKMAPGTWNKYHDGGWQQPGIGGQDGAATDPLGLNPGYDPVTSQIDFTGHGADGTPVDYRSVYANADGAFAFDAPGGVSYTANTQTGTITDASGAAVGSVSYHDPAMNAAVTISGTGTAITMSVTRANGTVQSGTLARAVLEDTSTHRLYLPQSGRESLFTYNAYSGSYLSNGYNGYVYHLQNLGQPTRYTVVGQDPSGVYPAYLSMLDPGSLTNQNVSTSSYRIISSLSGGMWDVTLTSPSKGQTSYLRHTAPADESGAPVSAAAVYRLAAGHVALCGDGGQCTTGSAADRWRLVAVPDEFNSAGPSGVYKLQNVATGKYLQVTGSTPQARRAVGASVGLDAAQPDADPAGNGGNGTPGGSDQWYLEPTGHDSPATLTAGSPRDVVAAADRTSLAGVTAYKLVNRNSGLVLQFTGGQWRLAGQQFGDSAQNLTITKAP